MNLNHLSNVKLKIGSKTYFVFTIKGEIEISKPYIFEIGLIDEEIIDIKNQIMKEAMLTYELNLDEDNKTVICISGYIHKAEVPIVKNKKSIQTILFCHPLYKLTLTSNLVVFSEKTIKEIIIDRLNSIEFSNFVFKLNNTEKLSLIQYGENDMKFLEKLMFNCGIFYFFNFKDNSLIFSDDVNFYSSSSSKTLSALISDELTVDPKNTIIFAKKNNITNLTKISSLSENQFSQGMNISYVSYASSEISLEKGLLNSKKMTRGFIRQYLCADLTFYPGVIYKEEIVFKMFFDTSSNNETQNIVFFTANKQSYFIPEYIPLSLPVFMNAVIAETKDKHVSDENEFIKISPFFDDKKILKARYSTLLAGNNYGISFLPRGGMEVIVAYFDDLLAYPFIFTCVYNEKNKKPYKDEFTSFIKTESIGQEGNINSEIYNNEIIFFDKQNNENFKIAGRRDMMQHAMNKIEVIAKKEYDLETIKMSIDAKESYNLDTIDIKVTSKDSYELTTSKLVIKIKEGEIVIFEKGSIKCPKLIIDSANMKINNVNLEINTSSLEINAKVAKLNAELLQIESKIIKIKSELVQID